MDVSPGYSSFILQFKTDHIHGASHLVSVLLATLRKELEDKDHDVQKTIILWTCDQIKDAHADMIEIANICRILLEQPSLKKVIYLEEGYRKAKTTIADLATRWLLDCRARSILTLSHSSLVEETLVIWTKTCLESNFNHNADTSLHIHVLESRPNFEGRVLLKRVSERLFYEIQSNKVQLHLWADPAVNLALNKVDCAIMGADRILKDRSIVNKVGSLSLAVLAKMLSIPVIVVASTFKLDHSLSTPRLTSPVVFNQQLHEPSELLTDDELLNVQVENWYFEIVPFDYLSVLIHEKGIQKLH